MADDTIQDLVSTLSETTLVSNPPITSDSGLDDAQLVSTPAESLASAIVDIVLDIRRIHDEDHPEATPGARHESASTEFDLPEERRASSTRLNIRRFWRLGRSSSPVPASSSQHEENAKAHNDEDRWMALMDAVVSRTNDIVAAQTVVENDPFLKSRNPPLFWLLYNGHK